MKTVQKHFSALNRTIHEAVRIRRQSIHPSTISLNSKGEFGFCSLSRLTLSTNECSKSDDKPSVETNQKVFEFSGSKERESKKRKANYNDDLNNQKLKHQSTNSISKYFPSKNSTGLSTFYKPNRGGVG